ncbi:MAG: preprotein translocase subunit SecA [Rhodospirillales bacterium]|nr:preprotein translocase subunit SecA [Rhodospirillales bacterium]MCB9973592.1 preprotein translocase subunit SecA [Rhodospirillales bacterium]MCB9979604.1 preprotein translocase subunit SecA [Rhodospirillales bacterium]
MILSLATKLFGSSNDRQLKKYQQKIQPINDLEAAFEKLGDSALQAKTLEFRQKLANGADLDDILPEAFATVREAAKRVLGQRHYDVQLIGGMVLNDGKIAEMRTGEGKTLVATLPSYLNAVSGKGVHVVTVNDYLARRDAEWMGRVHNFLGLSTGCIIHDLNDQQRRAAYAADVTYGTNNEFGFDYLRDNMKFSLEDMSQRPFNYAIVDEVDSILVDEARTPLIISGPAESSTELYGRVDKVIPEIGPRYYDLDEKMRTVTLNEDGQELIEDLLRRHNLLEDGNLYDLHNIGTVHHLNNALKAHVLFHKDKDYIVQNGKVMLIDEFTGRMMEGRRLSDGLHQAIEAKEGVPVQNENQTLASITFQNYFRLYPKLAGMTGTALTEAAEFHEIYNLDVVAIPTNLPVQRIDHEDKIYKTFQEKVAAIVELVQDCQERQQPVLVGTVSIEKSELLSEAFKKAKIKHNVLNARYHAQEAAIVAQAGRAGAVTIATNMAGRGTDIKMGGDADMRIATEIDPTWPEERQEKQIQKITEEVRAEREIVKAAGGLFIIGTERHESRRIDNQLRGRTGRQGDPGGSAFFLSLDDDLMRIFGSDKMEMLLSNKNIGLKDGEALTHPWISKALERAQARVEAQNFEIRKNILKFDDVMNAQRKVIYDHRRDVMNSDQVEDLVEELRHDYISILVAECIPLGSYVDQWNIDRLTFEAKETLGLDVPIAEWAKEEGIADQEIEDRLVNESDRKMAEKVANIGPDYFRRMEKAVVLQILDTQWKEHLLALDHLRQGINLRAYGQRDPLNEFKTEAFSLFESMQDGFRENVTKTLSLVELNTETGLPGFLTNRRSVPTVETRTDPALMGTGRADMNDGDTDGLNRHQRRMSGRTSAVVTPIRSNVPFNENDLDTWGKVPRNALCPCGSGKKFKQCHGKIA